MLACLSILLDLGAPEAPTVLMLAQQGSEVTSQMADYVWYTPGQANPGLLRADAKTVRQAVEEVSLYGGLFDRQKKTRQEPGQITVISLMRRYLRVRNKGCSNIDQSRDQL